MEFDVKRVYTAVNADELKVGSKVICSDSLYGLEEKVDEEKGILSLTNVRDGDNRDRFEVETGAVYSLAYLVSEPDKLKWTDLKIGDVIRRKELPFIKHLITGIDEGAGQVFACVGWLKDNDLADWEKVEE